MIAVAEAALIRLAGVALLRLVLDDQDLAALMESGRRRRRRSGTMSLTGSVVMVQVVSSRCPSTVQTGGAGRAVPTGRGSRQDGRCGAAATAASTDVALQTDTDRAAATRRTLTSWALS